MKLTSYQRGVIAEKARLSLTMVKNSGERVTDAARLFCKREIVGMAPDECVPEATRIFDREWPSHRLEMQGGEGEAWTHEGIGQNNHFDTREEADICLAEILADPTWTEFGRKYRVATYSPVHGAWRADL